MKGRERTMLPPPPLQQTEGMGLGKKKTNNAPPKAEMRNQAVQAVGERYFQVALTGIAAAGLLAIVAVSIGGFL